MKHRKTPQVNMGVNYIAKHNASIDESSEMTQPSTATFKNFTENVHLISTMIDSTLNLWDNSTIYNISTIATTKSTVEELNTTEISLTPLHNVAVRQSTNHSGNILEFINLILPSSTTTQTARTSENEINDATQIGKCLLIYDIEMRCHYTNNRQTANHIKNSCIGIKGREIEKIDKHKATTMELRRRQRRPKKVTQNDDSFGTSYLLIQDWYGMMENYV